MVSSSQVSSSRRGAKLPELRSGARQLAPRVAVGKGAPVSAQHGSLRVYQWSGCPLGPLLRPSRPRIGGTIGSQVSQPLARFPCIAATSNCP